MREHERPDVRAGTCAASSRDESNAWRDGGAAGPLMSSVSRRSIATAGVAACAAAIALIARAAQAEPAPAAGNPTAHPPAPHGEKRTAKGEQGSDGSDAINPYDNGGVIIRHR